MKSAFRLLISFILLSALIIVGCSESDYVISGNDEYDTLTAPLSIQVEMPYMVKTRGYPTTFYQPLDTICDSMQIAFVACGDNGDTTYYGNGNNYCVFTFDSLRNMWIPDDPIVIGSSRANLYPYYPYFIKLAYHYDFSHKHQLQTTSPLSQLDSIRALVWMPDSFTRPDGIYRQVDYMYGRKVNDPSDPYNSKEVITAVNKYPDVKVTMLHAQAAIFICLNLPNTYFSGNQKGRLTKVEIGDLDYSGPPSHIGTKKIFTRGYQYFDIMNGCITRNDSTTKLSWTVDTCYRKTAVKSEWVDTIVCNTFIAPVYNPADLIGPDVRIAITVDGKSYISPLLQNNQWKPGHKYYYYLTLANALGKLEVIVRDFTMTTPYGDRTSGDNNGIYMF